MFFSLFVGCDDGGDGHEDYGCDDEKDVSVDEDDGSRREINVPGFLSIGFSGDVA